MVISNIVETYIVQVLFLFIYLLEIYGAAVIIFSANVVFFHFLKTRKDGQSARLALASHLVFGLELFLGAEILRTVISRNIEEIKVLAAIIAIRSILTLLISWEVRQGQKEQNR